MSEMRGRGRSLDAVYLRWIWWRALLHDGWWLIAAVYLVVDAGLTPSELVLISAAQGLAALVFEIPAGVFADTVSRRWSLVISHALMGTAMIATALVTDYPAIVLTQMLWGLSWNFASGADVAWITDELDRPDLISVVLVRSGRAQLTGAAAGIVALGAVGSLISRSTAMIAAGVAMLVLGLYVALRFSERRFVAASTRRVAAGWAIFASGAKLVWGNRTIMVMVFATFLVNGGSEAGRLYQKRLVDLDFPASPVIWFAGLGVVTLVAGAAALRLVEPRVNETRAAWRGYVASCVAGALGLVGLAAAPDRVSASVAVLFVAGVAVPLTRTIGVIWVNRQTTAQVRATTHSFLAQAEYFGEIVWGLAIAGVAHLGGLPSAFVACALLFVATIGLLSRAAVASGREVAMPPTSA
jgi:MFS transporter, DHA3 family, tetracycline resistance protein